MSKKNFAAPYPPEQGGGQDSTAAAASTAQPGAVFAQDDAVSDAKEKKKKKINWKDRKTKKIIKRIIIWTIILGLLVAVYFWFQSQAAKVAI